MSESVGKCRTVSEVSEVSEVVDENVRNVTTILKTEENLGIMQYWE